MVDLRANVERDTTFSEGGCHGQVPSAIEMPVVVHTSQMV